MVRFTSLSVENFKRFVGQHSVPLAGDGPITVIAAENGVGKTTLLDAFYLALHGQKGIEMRKNSIDFNFNSWLFNAFSSTAKFDGGFGKIGVRLEMETEEGFTVIDRQYWLDQSTVEYSVEENLYIDGNILRIEKGENKTQVIKSWLEALFPPAITQRFLVDGEQLGTLDVLRLGDQMKKGLDDVLGQGTVHRLTYHLRAVQRKTLSELAPAHEQENLSMLYDQLDQSEREIVRHQNTIKMAEGQLKLLSEQRIKLRSILEIQSEVQGSKLGKLRIDHAKSNSTLAHTRSIAKEYFTNNIPFIVGGLEDLAVLRYNEANEIIHKSSIQREVIDVLHETLSSVEPKLSESVKNSIHLTAEMVLKSQSGDLPDAFRFLNANLMEEFTLQHALYVDKKSSELNPFFSQSQKILNNHRTVTRKLKEAAQLSGLAKAAEELEDVSAQIGRFEGQISQLKAKIVTLEKITNHDTERIEALQSRASSDSKHVQISNLVDQLRPIIEQFAHIRRSQLAQPLSENFRKGFELLSRKAERIKAIHIDSKEYNVEIELAGFDGNWLDRDLSATERQHVGLSLLFALRRLSTTALPVVVDTPTSRMDARHKGYSVTQFYPKLSHQVIVLATSDDLAGGLYEELLSAGSLGQEVLLKESGDAAVEVKVGGLAAFF